MSDEKPLVSIVLPMLNEIDSIEACLRGFAVQSYGVEHLDVMVVDAASTDGSRQLVDRYCLDHPWCRVVDNPKRKAAAAFNVGVEHARGEVLVLFSSHGVPMVDFVERSVAVLQETGAAGVGGRYHHIGTDPVSSAIGLAMVSPFGMASPHRSMKDRQDVDTISHPAYDIEVMRAVGPFDERLERNSDYEFNHRVLVAGHRLVADPTIESIYRPRGSHRALARQFWWYGRWKERVVRRHPASLKGRHLVPPVVVSVLAAAPLWARGPRRRRLLGAGALSYAGLLALAVHRARPRDHAASASALAICFPLMHGAWGAGFVVSFLEDGLRKRKP